LTRVKYLHHIPASPKRSMILTRLGYKTGTTMLDDRYTNMLEEAIKLGSILCKPQGAYAYFQIVERSNYLVKLENGIEFKSNSLSKLLQDCKEIVLMASTVGSDVVERIVNEVEKGDAAIGLTLDSVASQTADATLDWMMEFLNRSLIRKGKLLTKHRYSPGFGDMPLSYQKPIFEALMLERLEMKLTEKFMIIPEKSVIAIAGVQEKRSVGHHG